MNGEQRSDESARPSDKCQFSKSEKQKDCSCDVQKNVREMMTPRLQAVHLAIQHMRDCGKWVPVRGMDVREGPPNSAERKSPSDVWIFVNVVTIVVADEVVPESPAESEPDQGGKENTDCHI